MDRFRNIVEDPDGERKSDVDKGHKSTRHTLGRRPGQAAPGEILDSGKAWKDLNLDSGWSNYGSGFPNASYCVDGFGFVHLRGRITGGTLAGTTQICHGNPPSFGVGRYVVQCGTGSVTGVLSVRTDGTITIIGTMLDPICLDGIVYKAAWS